MAYTHPMPAWTMPFLRMDFYKTRPKILENVI